MGVTIRETERRQLVELLDDAATVYDDRGLDGKRELMAETSNLFGEKSGTDEYDLSETVWDNVVVGLNELDGSHPGWLASKIARRARLKGTQMGFATATPIGTRLTNEVPE